MESWHDPVPEQAPVQPAKVEPVFATAVSCTGVPMLKPAVQVVPQLIPVGLLVTAPIPVPVSATVTVAPLRSKPAVTDSTEFISTWHDPVPEQAPVQPVNVESGSATAVSWTVVPLLKLGSILADLGFLSAMFRNRGEAEITEDSLPREGT